MRTAKNICTVYKDLYELKMKQDARHGDDGGIKKFSKPANMIVMP